MALTRHTKSVRLTPLSSHQKPWDLAYQLQQRGPSLSPTAHPPTAPVGGGDEGSEDAVPLVFEWRDTEQMGKEA